MPDRFSIRYGIQASVPDITITQSFPLDHRVAVIQIASDLGVSASSLRWAMLRVLVIGIDTTDWSHDFIWPELVYAINECNWWDVYEIAEEVYKIPGFRARNEYANRLNLFFLRKGFGWEMRDGLIEYRGSEPYQEVTESADQTLQYYGLNESSKAVREARRALSRRPDPDLPGAVYHAMRALEAVARSDTGDSDKSLGALVSSLDLPKPLDEAVRKLWGFSSQYARHGSEEKVIDLDEAELVVTVACATAAFIAKRQPWPLPFSS